MGERLVYPTRVNFTNAEVGRLGTVIYETARELALVTLPPLIILVLLCHPPKLYTNFFLLPFFHLSNLFFISYKFSSSPGSLILLFSLFIDLNPVTHSFHPLSIALQIDTINKFYFMWFVSCVPPEKLCKLCLIH